MNIRYLVFTLLLAFQFASATETNTNDSGLAIHGYDPVAYFEEGKPIAGDAQYDLLHNGVTYQFKSSANREAFLANPERFVPKYGGYCSYGVRLGKKFDVDPTAWAVVDDELYLQLNHGTQAVWRNDLMKNIEIAERLWPEIQPIPAAQLEETNE